MARGAPYLNDLNPAQRAAVEQLDGPVLMLAGAGTGKTKALTARIVHLLNTGRAQPNEILAVTFTNKAAREMKERVARLLGQSVEGMPWLGTFHSICVKILRRHAELVGLKSNFTILDTDDQLRLLKQLVQAAGIDDKRWPARMLAGIIDGWKNRAWLPENLPAAEGSAYDGMGPQLYAQYQTRLRELNAADFGDLLLHVVSIFQKHDDVLALYQRWFKYVLVDEYQDTNVAQYLWLRLLAGGHKNICCVGDDDQSIYGWRGAEVGNILRFEKDFPGAAVVRLEQNYRSTPHILAAAAGVIAGNENRLGKELWTEVEEGEKVRLIGHWDGEEEARWIGEEAEALQRGTRGIGPKSLDDMAILVRASHQMRAFEDRFLTIGMPYRVIGGPRFYERLEIRDAMAYFRLVVSPEDDLAFERVSNTPKRGLGDKAQQKIQMEARANFLPLTGGAQLLLDAKGIGGKGAVELVKFTRLLQYYGFLNRNVGDETQLLERREEHACLTIDLLGIEPNLRALQQEFAGSFPPLRKGDVEEIEIAEARNEFARKIEVIEADYHWKQSRCQTLETEVEILGGNHILLAEKLLDESGYTEMWQNDKTPEAPGRLENLKELVKALEQFENLQGFLEHVGLIMDNDKTDADEKISIMTLHAAK
ncbi:ATP-dependent helicase, partial [Lentibacter algarum]|uniref:ATP-dependent helicase n=1 Tax=Lentibacter algarum TaxID=576131 RepID=UPI002353FC3D